MMDRIKRWTLSKFDGLGAGSNRKGELLRLLAAIVWFVFAAFTMAMVQINGDSLHASQIRSKLEVNGVKQNIVGMFDVVFDNLPNIPSDSIFNPDFALHSFILFSIVAALVHWPLLKFIQRLRRFLWLFGFGYFLRMFCLAGTVFPPSHPDCIPIERTIIQSITMTIPLLFGLIHTCTDKMFSGHTIVATLLLWFWNKERSECGDRKISIWRIYALLHFLFMVTTSILGRNHYTVDIVMSFIVNTLTFSVYMTILTVGSLQRGLGKTSWKCRDDGESIGVQISAVQVVGKSNFVVGAIEWMEGVDLRNDDVDEEQLPIGVERVDISEYDDLEEGCGNDDENIESEQDGHCDSHEKLEPLKSKENKF